MKLSEKNIIKELYLKDNTFNLKSSSTGKYSVHDSYKDNLKNGFLTKINAPEDIKNSLKDIYYATERGVVISYKDFNAKIASIRKDLMSKSFPNKDIKELNNEDRIKIEMSSAKQVLKDLAINESTKLIYSPEITNSIEEITEIPYKLFFVIEESKILFEEIQDEEKAKLVKAYLEFSEKIRKITDKAVYSNNLDDVELSIIEIDKIYDNLEDLTKANHDVKTFYSEQISKLKNFAEELKQRQIEYQNHLDSLIDKIIKEKDYKSIRETINSIEKSFYSNYLINQDTKSKSIRDFAINQLKNTGKIIALVSLASWEDKHFSLTESLLKEPLDLDLIESLKEKHTEQDLIKRQEKEDLDKLDINDSNKVFDKLQKLANQKDLFLQLFDKIKLEDKINLTLENSENIHQFIILLSNNLDNDSFDSLLKSISENNRENLLNGSLDYKDINDIKNRDIYYLFVTEFALNDIVENIFLEMEAKYLKQIDEDVLAKIIIRISKFTYKPDEILKKINLAKLISMLDLETVKNHDYLKSAIVRTLMKWFPRLDTKSEEFKKLLLEYPDFSIYEISRKQLKETDPNLILAFTEKIENNKELLAELVKKLNKEKIDSVIQAKLDNELNESPNDFDKQYNVSMNNIVNEKYDAAIKGFKKCISINTEDPTAHYMIGYCYELKNLNDIAISFYKKAIQLKYNYIEAYLALGILYTKMKDHFLATQQFKKILKVDPNNYDACLSLGVAYDDMGELDQALEYYDKAIIIDPEKSDAYINKGIIYTIKEDADKALENYIIASEKSQGNAKVQYNLGILYHAKKDYIAAIAHYKLSIRFDPTNAMAYNNLGLVYFSKVRVHDAITTWEKAIEIDSQNVDSYNNLAWAYSVVGEIDKSIATYKKTIEINPKHAIAYMNLGTVYYKNNQIDMSIKQLEKYLDLEPNSDKSYEVIQILKSLREQLKNDNLNDKSELDNTEKA